MALESVISPAVLYPMVNVLFRQSNFHPIDSILSQLYCSTLGLNRNFLRAVLHSPTCLGGIGVPSPKHRITRDHINYFLYNVWRPLDICHKLELSIIYTQLEVGMFTQFFALPFSMYGDLATPYFGYQFKPSFAGLHNFRGRQPYCDSCDNHRKKLLLQAATRSRLYSRETTLSTVWKKKIQLSCRRCSRYFFQGYSCSTIYVTLLVSNFNWPNLLFYCMDQHFH